MKQKMFLGALNIIKKSALSFLLLGVLAVCFFLASESANAVTGINQQLNFQGRLYNAQGATVPDGYYNIQFKIYQDGDGQTAGNTTGSPVGVLKWTEDHLNNNSQGIQIKNGFLSVDLGSITAFGSSIDWNQSTLYLSVNIAGTGATCTPFASCSPDGEMIPMKRLSSTPYSLNSGMLGGLASSQFVQLAQGVQTDASLNTASIFINKTNTGNLINLQSSGNDAFIINNAGDINFGSNSNHTMTVATAGVDIAGKSLTVSAGTAGSGAAALAGGDLLLQGGTAGGTNSNGGNVAIDAGAKTGLGADGKINIGTSVASTIQIGSTTLATGTQTINIGNNNTAGSTTNITIGSGNSATAGTTTMQSKGNMSLTSSGSLTETSVGDLTLTTSAGNLGLVATAGTLTGTSSGNLSLTSSAGIAALSGTSTTITSTTTTVGISSKANTTISTNGATRATFDTANNLFLGNGTTGAVNPFVVSATGGTAGVAGSGLAIQGGVGGSAAAGGVLTLSGGSGGSTSGAGGAVTVQGGNATAGNSNGGNITINAGTRFGVGVDGAINIGTANVGNTIQVGSVTAATGTQTINIGNNNTAGSTTNIIIGSGNSATGGSTTIQSKGNTTLTSGGQTTATSTGNMSFSSTGGTLSLSGNGNTSLTSVAGTIALSSSGNTTISTNGTVRTTIDNANNIYFGNGVTAAAPNNFAINGTGSTTTGVAGGTITVQGGNATVGSANGGNLNLSGGNGVGTGSNGLVVMSTPTFSTTTNDSNCYTGGSLVANTCTIAQASINNSAAVLVGFSTIGKTANMPDPTITTAGRVVYITAANGSQDFTLVVNGGGNGNSIAMRQNTTATMIWNGSDWTAAGASSSTTLQSAYDNTMQSAGGAELIVSKTGTTNGLTIRDSSTNPVNGTLLSVQTSSAAGLFSVNSNVTEYTSDSGAEVAGASASTFPANTWGANGSSTISRYTTAGNYIATGQASASTVTTTSAGDGIKNTLTTALTANTTYNVSFTARLASGIFTDMDVYYSINGTANSVACATAQSVNTSVWTKINCSFTAPSSGITSTNAILIRQTGAGTSRTFYVDNLSVAIAANYNYATDPGADDSVNFATNWSFVNATSGAGNASRNTSDGNDASDSATATITTGAANAGIRNKLSINPMPSTLYRITVYAKLTSGAAFNDFKIRYSRDGSTGSSGNYIDCTDYNTQIITTTVWTKVTCYVTTDAIAATNPHVNFVEGSSAVRVFSVDTFSMTLSTSSTPNVQIGGGINGGPVTLLTLDRGASAPIASDNDALLGSMYYDTSLGKLQCYEADGWGACGSSPDNVVTISPEYTNAVLHGTGIGTMTSDLCSDTLDINDGSFSQPTICGSNETYNFYKWTSPQASAQTYSVFVTYQLPNTFKTFASGQTSLMGRTDSANSTVQYQVYRNSATSGLTSCGTSMTVSTGSVSTWQLKTASGSADPSTCGFGPGDSIVFKINLVASLNANAYIGNLNFIFSNK